MNSSHFCETFQRIKFACHKNLVNQHLKLINTLINTKNLFLKCTILVCILFFNFFVVIVFRTYLTGSTKNHTHRYVNTHGNITSSSSRRKKICLHCRFRCSVQCAKLVFTRLFPVFSVTKKKKQQQQNELQTRRT